MIPRSLSQEEIRRISIPSFRKRLQMYYNEVEKNPVLQEMHTRAEDWQIAKSMFHNKTDHWNAIEIFVQSYYYTKFEMRAKYLGPKRDTRGSRPPGISYYRETNFRYGSTGKSVGQHLVELLLSGRLEQYHKEKQSLDAFHRRNTWEDPRPGDDRIQKYKDGLEAEEDPRLRRTLLRLLEEAGDFEHLQGMEWAFSGDPQKLRLSHEDYRTISLYEAALYEIMSKHLSKLMFSTWGFLPDANRDLLVRAYLKVQRELTSLFVEAATCARGSAPVEFLEEESKKGHDFSADAFLRAFT
jgi:hypothetical protein